MTTVRSCVLPAGRHDELPPTAYACPGCQRHLVRQLADIEDYLGIVTPEPGRTGGYGPTSRQYGSRPPLRLDVIAMFDPRTEINGPGDDDILDEIPNVWADLNGWSGIVHQEHPDQPAGSGAWFLRVWCSWIVTRPWVDEFAVDVTRVHAALRQACGDAPGKALGHCLDAACGGQVYRRSDDPRDPRLRCGHCSTTYDGLDLVRIRFAS